MLEGCVFMRMLLTQDENRRCFLSFVHFCYSMCWIMAATVLSWAELTLTMPPRVSICLPTRNRLVLLKRAIGSVMAQSIGDFELLVVDDGSSDGTWEYLESLGGVEPRLRPIRHNSPKGACATRNAAILAASAEYITGIDDDDYWYPEHLASHFLRWEQGECAGLNFCGVYADNIVIDPLGRKSRKKKPKWVDSHALLRRNYIGNQLLTRRKWLIAVGGFDPALPAWQDLDLWLRMTLAYGRALGTGEATYCVDESHGASRISAQAESRLLVAWDVFCTKHEALLSSRSKEWLRLNCLGYPQAAFGVSDFLRAARAGFLIRAIAMFVRKRMVLRVRRIRGGGPT